MHGFSLSNGIKQKKGKREFPKHSLYQRNIMKAITYMRQERGVTMALTKTDCLSNINKKT